MRRRPVQVAVEVELFLELERLVARVARPGTLLGEGRVDPRGRWTLGALWGRTKRLNEGSITQNTYSNKNTNIKMNLIFI